MKFSFTKTVDHVIGKSDIIIEVIDARLITETRNYELEEKIHASDKRLIICINKCDLVPFEYIEEQAKQIPNCVFISGKKHLGTSHLRELIYKVAAKSKSEEIVVGIVGYPNTGKSSVINALKGHGAAPVSHMAGHTKGKQLVRISERIMLLDSPGVIPFAQHDEIQLGVLGVKNAEKIKDPDLVAEKMLEIVMSQGFTEQIEQKFNIMISNETPDELLEKIAISRNKVIKGGLPDVRTMGKIIIHEWQKGTLTESKNNLP